MATAKEKILRKVLFEKATSKKHLKDWIINFLDIDIPDTIVCDDNSGGHEGSNSSPMDLIWEVYQKALDGKDEKFQKVLVYAARDSYKTVSASILELLCLFHLNRNIAHMAAIEAQAAKCQEYLSKYIERPILRDYITSKNKRTIEITRYVHQDTGQIISPKQWDVMPVQEKDLYTPHSNYMKILVATLAGSNSEHVPFMCVEGESQILINSPNPKRDRVARTARGIFKRLAGRSAGGRSGGEKEESFDIVDSDIKFLSYNVDTGRMEFKPVTHAHCRQAEVLKITFDDGKQIECTKSHPLYVFPNGFTPAQELSLGQSVISINKAKSGGKGFGEHVGSDASVEYLRHNYDEWDQVVLGSLLGDGGVYIRENGNPWFREQHCLEQTDYLNWKRSIINNKVRTIDVTGVSGYTGTPQVGFQSGHSPAFVPYIGFKDTLVGIERLDALGLAVWYMDDGCKGNGLRFSSESFTKEQNELLAAQLNSKFNIKVETKNYAKNGKTYYYLSGGIEAKRRMVEVCLPFIQPTMAYKFDLQGNRTKCKFCGNDVWFYGSGNRSQTCGKIVCQQLKTGTLKKSIITGVTNSGIKWVYDFTVEGNHNFIANGLLNKNCLDELDLAPEKPVEEARMIPSTGPNGELPITFMISSRKFKFGLVQKELNKSTDPKSNIQVRHWNLLDVSKPCPPEKHLPNEPKIPIFINEDKMESVSKEDFNILSDEEKNHYQEAEGYQGCLKNCSLFAACRGRLATKQAGTSKLLKPLPLITETFKSVSPETAQAQLMCWKPSSVGSIYPHFARSRHMKTANDMVEMVEGTSPHHPVNKAELIEVFKRRGWTFHLGMDFGFTHNFAAILAATDGWRVFVIDVMSVAGLELNEKVEACKAKYLALNPTVYPDPAYPSDIKTFKKNGFRCKKFEKMVLLGIDAVRTKLMPGMNREPEMFLLAGDSGCDLLAKRLEVYHWKLDAAGEPTEEPDKSDDDECFTEETEVLSNRGWISLKDVTAQDDVVSVTNQGEFAWEKPEIVNKTYSGILHKINHVHLEFTATQNHRHAVMTQSNWRVKHQFLLEKRSVSEMSGEMYWANSLQKWPVGKGLFKQGADEAWMAGFWLAEGCFDNYRPTYIIVDQTKLLQQAQVRAIAAKLNWHYSETINGKSIRFIFSGQGDRVSKWKGMFREMSHLKRLTIQDVLSMTESERLALWDGYMAGDGSRTKGNFHFDTVSKELADGMQFLSLTLGYGCRIVSYNCMRAGRIIVNPQGKEYTSRQSFRGHVLKKKPVAHINRKDFVDLTVKDLPVYCVRVSTGQFLARTNGKVFVAGNCDALRYLCQNLFGKSGKLIVAGTEDPKRQKYSDPYSRENWMGTKINELTSNSGQGPIKGKRGSFIFDV